jgi:hypothetical protein
LPLNLSNSQSLHFGTRRAFLKKSYLLKNLKSSFDFLNSSTHFILISCKSPLSTHSPTFIDNPLSFLLSISFLLPNLLSPSPKNRLADSLSHSNFLLNLSAINNHLLFTLPITYLSLILFALVFKLDYLNYYL